MGKSLLRAAGASILIAVAAAAVPQAASAELVFDRGPDIYAANDDGSNLHPLVRASWLGMDNGLWTPAVAPSGTVVTFMGETLRNDVQDPHGDGTHYYGSSADGAYVLSGGDIVRLTPEPAPAGYSSGGDIDPEPVAGGQYAFQHWSCTEVYGQFGYDNQCEHAMFTAPLSQGALASTAFGECATAADPTQDPSTSTLRLAYGGCTYNADPNNFLSEDREAIYVSGPGHQDEHAIAVGEDAGQTGGIVDPSFSLDGRQVVAYDTGGGRDDFDRQPAHFTVPAALRVFDAGAAQPSEGRVLVQAPQDNAGKFVALESPRYISADTIAFTADGSIWTVPADCDNCTLDDATELIPGSFDDDTGIGAVAWTSKAVQAGTAPPPPPNGGNGGGGGGGTGGGGTTQPQPQPTPQPTPIPQPAPAPAGPALKLPGGTLKVKRGKLKLSLTCGTGTTICRGTLILARGKSSLGHVAYTIAAGRKKTFTLTLTRAGRKALAKAHGHRLKVRLTSKPAGGRATSRTITLKG